MKETVDYRRLRKYEDVNGKERLIVPVTEDSNSILLYVQADELFDIFHDSHLKAGHGGHTRMEKELKTREVVDTLVSEEDLEKIEQEIEDAINAGSTFGNDKAAAVAMEVLESSDQFSDNNYAKTFCVVCEKECSSGHSCGSCGKDVHAICGISKEADEGHGGKITCKLYHNKQEIRKKRSAACVNLQGQVAKMLKISNAKFPPVKVGDNIRVRIPDVDRGLSDPKRVLAIVLKVVDGFYKLGTEHGVLGTLYSRSEFSIVPEILLPLESLDMEKSLRNIACTQSLISGQGYNRCKHAEVNKE
ncbi:SCAN domain-containing protein 3 [Argiope bruennichi]|uniref:SCAN domain-containing protein 3 n=1 Tax=Argiope bruennichi TaxID=94029 RepID=A0A8T0ES50_ARGBR|nr:SCAN domain-containing protein 3 [Argiope bruennichi]